MKILQLHNQYRAYGGEDAVADLEHNLLLSHGHEVERLTVSNESIERATLRTGLETVWSQRSHRMTRDSLRSFRPDILHVHNTFPQLSPSVYWAAKSCGVPVVQTLHNYRLTCVNALLLRDGVPCELCVRRRLSWPGIRYKCYRNSAPASAAIAAMQGVHRAIGTYENKVDAYITVTEFARSVMVRSGLPKEIVHVKPNFVPEPEVGIGAEREEKVVFVGRLSEEKGVDLLLEARAKLEPSSFRLVMVGDGPERGRLETSARKLPGLQWRGWMSQKEALREVASSRFLVVPSITYEGFPMVVAEAMSVGTPVIAADHAGFPEIVGHGRAGLLFEPRNPDDLAKKLSEASLLEPEAWKEMSERARNDYLSSYTPEANYEILMEIYDEAMARSRRGAR